MSNQTHVRFSEVDFYSLTPEQLCVEVDERKTITVDIEGPNDSFKTAIVPKALYAAIETHILNKHQH